MLIKAGALAGYQLDAVDGEIGKVKEFYFDDRHWTIRYLVVETGTWLSDRQVLISPYALVSVNEGKGTVSVDLTAEQIEDSPSLETDKPVSRQFEQAYYGHYEYPTYWSGPAIWGESPYLVRDRRARDTGQAAAPDAGAPSGDPHLRSTSAVAGHHLQTLDGEAGHVSDFLIDDDTWAIRYLVVDTHDWWPGKKVLVSTQWLDRVSWGERKVFVNLTREAIKNCPEYTEATLLDREYENALHAHYGRPGYWIEELAAQED